MGIVPCLLGSMKSPRGILSETRDFMESKKFFFVAPRVSFNFLFFFRLGGFETKGGDP